MRAACGGEKARLDLLSRRSPTASLGQQIRVRGRYRVCLGKGRPTPLRHRRDAGQDWTAGYSAVKKSAERKSASISDRPFANYAGRGGGQKGSMLRDAPINPRFRSLRLPVSAGTGLRSLSKRHASRTFCGIRDYQKVYSAAGRASMRQLTEGYRRERARDSSRETDAFFFFFSGLFFGFFFVFLVRFFCYFFWLLPPSLCLSLAARPPRRRGDPRSALRPHGHFLGWVALSRDCGSLSRAGILELLSGSPRRVGKFRSDNSLQRASGSPSS